VRLLLALLISSMAGAQQPSPSFDAASIKVNHSASIGMSGMIGIGRGGTLSMRNVALDTLIKIAYDLRGYQLAGGPGWIASTRYDVEAKPEHAVDESTARLMFQNLLADRFHLLVHHEQAAVSGFKLVIDKGGSKLKPSEGSAIGFRFMGPDKIQGPGDMQLLVWVLRGQLGVPVEDRTGIAGKYDIDLKWTPDAAAASVSEPSVSIFAAIREQLGLSLQTTKVAIDRIVIDRVERPTEN
jgi:uncharacterized protein (TIGR03435 family)